MDVSAFTSSNGSPPLAETLYNPPIAAGANTIILDRFQDPPLPEIASHIFNGEPELISIFIKLPFVKYAICFPSGDQNGYHAPSVPFNTFACSDFNDLTQSFSVPKESLATKTILVPSFESSYPVPSPPTYCVSGGGIIEVCVVNLLLSELF